MELPELDSAELESRVKEKRKYMMEKSLNQSAPSTSEPFFPLMSSSPGTLHNLIVIFRNSLQIRTQFLRSI